jgi:hypothetical protein
VVSLAEELGSRAGMAGVPDQSAAARSPAMAGGLVIVNDFGRTIDPWSPTDFAGAVDDRY